MAGHSHWANIAHKKGRIDKKRGALFGKLSRAIIVAARNGGDDPAMNLALRYAIDKARKNSMPKDNIDRAIKKGVGDTSGDNYEEITYEGYGVAGVAVLADALTENRNRTGGEVRKTFEVYGGNLGATGCVAWMFERKGLIVVPKAFVEADRLFELALEAGAEDVQEVGETFEVVTPIETFQSVTAAFEVEHIPTDSAELTRISTTTVELELDDARKLLKLLDALEENEDVQSVTSNFSISDEIMEQLAAEE